MKDNYADEGFVIIDGKLIDYTGKNKDITIPDCVKVIGSHSLAGDAKRVFIPASVEKIEATPFIDNIFLEEIEVAEDNPYYYSRENCLIERATKKIIKGTRLSDIPQDGSVTAIGEYAFHGVDSARLCISSCIITIESNAFGSNDDVTLVIEAEKKPEGWADDWDSGQGEKWDEVWWENGPGLLLEWGKKFSED